VETRIRIRLGDAEVECVGDEAFVVDRLPQLVEELIRRLSGQARPPVAPQQPVAPPSGAPGLISIAGVVRDYGSDVVVDGAKLKTVGLNPELAGESDADGRFVVSGQTTGDSGLIAVTGPDGYVTTTPIEVSTGVSTQVVPALTRAYVNLLYALTGLAANQNSSIVIVHLFTAAGDPLEMVPATDIGLSQGGSQVGDGPSFFGPSGDVNSSMVVSQAFDNQARAAFFNVPEGLTTFHLTAVGADGLAHIAGFPVLVLKGATVLRARLPA
jgi:hypothetical protein